MSQQQRSLRQKVISRVLAVLGFLFLAIWAAVTLAPLVITLLSSFKSQTDIVARPFSWPQEFLFDNYSRAWSGGSWGEPWYKFATNSVIATTTGILGGIGAGVFAGYAVARSETRFGGLLNRYFVLLITLPFVVTWIPLFAFADRFGVLSNPFVLGWMYAGRMIPFAAVMMRAYFSSFPLDLVESAQVDGATEFKTFRRIVMPLSWGGIIAVGLIQFIFLWNELSLAQILLLDPGSRTLPPGLSQFRGQFSIDFGAMYASLVLTLIPIIILYSFAQKKLTEGLKVGAMK